MLRTGIALIAVTFTLFTTFTTSTSSTRAGAEQQRASAASQSPATSLRLYVFDGGSLDVADPGRYQLKREEVDTDKFSVACFLVVHPRGVLMWDACAVPDGAWKPTGTPVRHHLVLPGSQERYVTLVKPLAAQLADAGHKSSAITHLALSHYHYDHTANANQFAGATWLVRQVEREALLSATPPDLVEPANFNALKNSKTVIVGSAEHDVFGDGTVVIKFAPGHTPGHQVLLVKLPKTGPVLLSGDLYHYPQERTLHRLPTFEFNKDQTTASRADVDSFLAKNQAQLWIQHDFTANAKLKKAPAYYE
jgi:glyoxylase-like metal-dependent hydrolase (beta-lactamase superfamily II)